MATKDTFIEAIGRRKTAIARVRLTEAKQNAFTVNDKAIEEYFATKAFQNVATEALLKKELPKNYSVSAKIIGGGSASQAEALRLGIARALVKIDESLREDLKHSGYLKRDPRMVERKKFGLKKARKAAQWSKR